MPPALEISPPNRAVSGSVRLPGSKSYTNRALLIAALAEGRSRITSALFSDDTHHMANSLRRLGIEVFADPEAAIFEVVGRGGQIPVHDAHLFVGNSGTTSRFLVSFLTLGRGRFVVDGEPRMRERPIQPLLDGLAELGARAYAQLGTGCPPVVVEANGLAGGSTRMPGDLSSQYFSAILLVGSYADRGVEVEVVGDLVSKPYLDLTGASMRAFGVVMEHDDYRRFRVAPGQRYQAREYTVEPDASAAAYFFAAAALTGGQVRVENLGYGSAQGDVRFVDVLEEMGCTVIRGEDFIELRGPRQLRGVDVDMNGISDQVQTLAAIAPFASGTVTIRNVAHIRHKETNRIEDVARELQRMGARVTERPDGLNIEPSELRPALVQTYNDHRMAMSLALVGLRVPGIRINDPGCVSKTFPDYFERLAAFAKTTFEPTSEGSGG